ncbi:hypothetical protein BDW74DRAFT_162709 [Aspergillus multicolor]|uniref:uncharacterized protein n=1 Tax=Aspergillus multicolor TaxID=41759 RepID=UPI003CCE2B90
MAGHDIYSLGVVLLEIALWRTARNILGVGLTRPPTGIGPGSRLIISSLVHNAQ